MHSLKSTDCRSASITQFLCPNLSELASRVRDSCDRGDWSATKSRKVLVCSPVADKLSAVVYRYCLLCKTLSYSGLRKIILDKLSRNP